MCPESMTVTRADAGSRQPLGNSVTLYKSVEHGIEALRCLSGDSAAKACESDSCSTTTFDAITLTMFHSLAS